MTHPEVFWIREKEAEPGQLGIMPRPRGGHKLKTDIRGLKEQGVEWLVCLLEVWELRALDLTEEDLLCEKHGIGFLRFPIPDFGVPEDRSQFLELVKSLSAKLDGGAHIVIHCHGGVGRSSMTAAGVLLERGVPAEQVFGLIGRYRGKKVPETREQEVWVLNSLPSIQSPK
jgi:protein-tyrosine phosphatase